MHHCCVEALERLRGGEFGLALHRRWGTDLAVGIALALIGSCFGLTAQRPRTRIVSAVCSSVAAAAGAHPLGRLVQRHLTTLPELRDVSIVASASRRLWGRRVVEVLTATSGE